MNIFNLVGYVFIIAVFGAVFYGLQNGCHLEQQRATAMVVEVGQCDDALIGAGLCPVVLDNGQRGTAKAPVMRGDTVKHIHGSRWAR